MKSIEILWFEDVNPFNEPVFGFPIIGKLSMRQMVILGMGALFSWMFYQTNGSFTSIAPLGFAAFLALKKQKVRSTEIQFFMLMSFYFFNRRKHDAIKTKCGSQLRPRKKTDRSSLGLAEPFNPKLDVVGNEINVREIYADPLKPIRLKIKLERIEGQSITNKQTKIVCDGNVVSTLSTDNNGELEAIIVPQTLGRKKIQIFAEGMEQPVFEEILSISSI